MLLDFRRSGKPVLAFCARESGSAGRDLEHGARMNHVALYGVGLAQPVQTDRITLSDGPQRVAALHHVARRVAAIGGKPCAARRGLAEMLFDAAPNRGSQFRPVPARPEVGFIAGVAD